jgi:hypothetical protein
VANRSQEPEPLADLWLPEQPAGESFVSDWEAERHEFRPDLVEPSLGGAMDDAFIGEEESPSDLPALDLRSQ